MQTTQKEPYDMNVETKYVVAAYNGDYVCQRVADGLFIYSVEISRYSLHVMLAKLWWMGISKNDVSFI